MRLPVKVQLGAFGTSDVAPSPGTLVTGRPAGPRPALVQRGPAQGVERFNTKDGELDTKSVARALNQLQRNVDSATAPARANPMANGHLFQGIPLVGPLLAGPTASAPSSVNLPTGYQYFDTTLGKPLFLNGSNWVDATGAVAYAASSAPQAYTLVNHGFGTPAVGCLLTNVSFGVVRAPPQLISTGTANDNNVASLLIPFYSIGGTAKADIYVFY